MRKYYLCCEITCDKCGISDTLSDGVSEQKWHLERHIGKYYVEHEGQDLCEDCYKKITEESNDEE